MIRSYLIAFLLILNFHSLWADDHLANQLKSFSKKVSGTGLLNYKEYCSECEQSESQTATAYSPFNKKSVELTVLSEARANEVFKIIKNSEDNSYSYPFDGCFARAQQAAIELDNMGIVSGKTFMEGEFYMKIKAQEFGWSYHVANLIMIKRNGKHVLTVIDPSLFDGPVSLEKWKEALLKNPKSKKRTEYFTKRYNYDPDSRYSDLSDYNDEYLEDMKLTNRNNSRNAEMFELMQKGNK